MHMSGKIVVVHSWNGRKQIYFNSTKEKCMYNFEINDEFVNLFLFEKRN